MKKVFVIKAKMFNQDNKPSNIIIIRFIKNINKYINIYIYIFLFIKT